VQPLATDDAVQPTAVPATDEALPAPPGDADAQPGSESGSESGAESADAPAQPDGNDDPYAALRANAVTETGVVTVYQLGDQWFLEIPATLLGRELFWYAELAEMPAHFQGDPRIG